VALSRQKLWNQLRDAEGVTPRSHPPLWRTLAPGLRRLAASFLVVGAFLAALAVASDRQLDTRLPNGAQVINRFGVEVTPAWAIPVAVTVGLLGFALALLIYRERSE
jgi:hypothetical protein